MAIPFPQYDLFHAPIASDGPDGLAGAILDAELFDEPAAPHVRLAPSTHIGAGGVATTARLTAGTGTFTAGKLLDDANVATVDIAGGGYTELEWCIELTADAEDAADYEFRVVVDGVALDTYTQTPELTVDAGGSPDVTVGLTGQAVTVSAGTLGLTATIGLTGEAVTASAGTITANTGSPDVTVALTGQAVTVSPGTLTPANTQALAGTVVTASAGSLAVTASLALLGQAVTAAAGTPALSSTVALTGSAATVSAGTLTPVPTFALSGSAVTTSTGTLGVSSTLPLSGLSVEAQPGAITPNIAGDITIALVGQAVTVSAGTITAEVPAAPSEPQYARGGGGGRGFDAKEAARKRKRDEALEATIRQMYRELTQEPATAELAAEVVAPITAPTAAKIPSTASVAFEKATTEIEIALRMLHGEIASLRKQREADEDEAREILEILDLID